MYAGLKLHTQKQTIIKEETAMKILNGISELVGHTPLCRLRRVEEKFGLKAQLAVKLERMNPAGSVKDRAALEMIEGFERAGKLKKGGTIIEPTSGNTGIGLAAIAAERGYRVLLTMPDSMSVERRKLLKAYGAELVLTEGKLGMAGALKKAEELHESTPNSIIAGQFSNPDNPKAHYKTTGPEIWEDTDGKVDCFIAGIGTGGTLCGTGRYLKEKNSSIKLIAAEPLSSPLLSGGKAGPHKIQGIGANFVPDNYDAELVDEIITVPDAGAIETARMLAHKEGLLCGISSGAALWAAIEVAKRAESEGKLIVALLPDTGERYLSSEIFE